MVTQSTLETTLEGLESLINKYKLNNHPDDKRKLKVTKASHSALRKVILMMEINGDISCITPISDGKKHGWMVIDSNNKEKAYCA